MKSPYSQRRMILSLALACLLTSGVVAAPAAEPEISFTSDSLTFQLPSNGGLMLRVQGPAGPVYEARFAAGASPSVRLGELGSAPLVDGSYTWEVALAPLLSDAASQRLQQAREHRTEGRTEEARAAVEALRAEGELPRQTRFSGNFRVTGGAIVAPREETENAGAQEALPEASRGPLTPLPEADVLFIDDVIVDANLCVGRACINGESFAGDTVRLKDFNLRVKFQDSSSTAFPSNDWQLTANESGTSGANKFSIDDVDGGTTPFTVEAGTRSNALYLDSTGFLGIGTAAPAKAGHFTFGDTPTIRLSQDTSSSFAAESWDLAGNEVNFFVRNVDNDTMPFRLRPEAPTDSLHVAASGDVSSGTDNPQASLHITRATGVSQRMLQLQNNAPIRMRFENTTGTDWTFRLNDGNWNITSSDSAGNLFNLDTAGNLTIAGTYSPPSDRNLKENFATVDPQTILEQLAEIPIARWNFKHDGNKTPHIGPVSQDFYAAFSVGKDDRHISTTDADGVALAAIQALYAQLRDKDEQLQALARRLEELERRTP